MLGMRSCAISGPISRGDQEANVRAFHEAAAVLRDERSTDPTPRSPWAWNPVHSPVEHPMTRQAAAESARLVAAGEDETKGRLYRLLMRECFRQILDSDVLFVLPGWRLSSGARGEIWLALQSGIEVRYYHEDPDRRPPFDGTLLVSLGKVGHDGWAVACSPSTPTPRWR